MVYRSDVVHHLPSNVLAARVNRGACAATRIFLVSKAPAAISGMPFALHRRRALCDLVRVWAVYLVWDASRAFRRLLLSRFSAVMVYLGLPAAPARQTSASISSRFRYAALLRSPSRRLARLHVVLRTPRIAPLCHKRGTRASAAALFLPLPASASGLS